MKQFELIHDRIVWIPCWMCWTKSPCNQYKIGKLEIYLCDSCKPNIIKILAEIKEEEELEILKQEYDILREQYERACSDLECSRVAYQNLINEVNKNE